MKGAVLTVGLDGQVSGLVLGINGDEINIVGSSDGKTEVQVNEVVYNDKVTFVTLLSPHAPILSGLRFLSLWHPRPPVSHTHPPALFPLSNHIHTLYTIRVNKFKRFHAATKTRMLLKIPVVKATATISNVTGVLRILGGATVSWLHHCTSYL